MGSRSNSSSLPAPVGLSDPQYQARRKSMFEFLTHVRALGADVELNVPAIAVLGWQSAGKSSLVEAISGITLPRAGGTCTRCPTECQLTHSEAPWTCTVSLQLNIAADGSKLLNPQKIPFGQPITEKSDVTERIRRAQRAILSPSTPPDVFLSAADTTTELSFSANRIVLNITGPDVTDLNFIDLPGLFVGGEEDEMQLIRDLAISYIEKPSCIILLTVSCETDFVNQGAHRLARDYDPAGDRTIGVLTKPDRIPATEEDNWVPYIRGEREDTTMWFCVKCPDSEAIKSGVTWEEARRDESLWFSRKVPWATLEEGFKQRLGTANLTGCLSDKLCDLIAERLPQIEQELNKLLERIKRDLDDLPPAPSSAPLSEVLRLITDFAREVEKQGEGIPGRDGLLHQVKQPQDEFRVAIRRTAPCFVPQFRNRPVSERPVVDTRVVVSRSTSALPEKHAQPPFLVGEEDRDEIGLNDGEKIFIDDVLQSAEWAVTRELPNTYPFIVQKEYIESFVMEWDEPAHTLFKTVSEKVKEATLRIVEAHFGNYTHSRFKQRVSNIVVAHLEECSKATSDLINLLLKIEMEPSTTNTNYFTDYQKKFLSFYKGLFHKDSNDNFVERVQGRMNQSSDFTRALDTIISNLPKIGFHNVTPLDLGVLKASEESEHMNALKIMADVRAYFQVAFKRFVDNTVKAIDEELVLGTSNELQEALVSGLKLDSPDAHDACVKLVAEQPHIAEKRKALEANEKKLKRAREELYNVLS